MLLSLSICCCIIMSIPSIYKVISKTSKPIPQYEEVYIAAKQLSQYTMGCRYKSLGEHFQYVDYNNQEFDVILNHNRLVKTPGFEILISGIHHLNFYQKDRFIYMTFDYDRPYCFLLCAAIEYETTEK